MSKQQKDALKAAYAVGAARRAAKMAWMKVIQKVDEPTAKRQTAISPNAPSVAADTAMKALVAALKSKKKAKRDGKHDATMVETSFPVAEGGRRTMNESPDDALRLPRDKKWAQWRGRAPRDDATKSKHTKKQASSADEYHGDDVPVNFGMELPQLTNKDAEKDAEKILRAEQHKLTNIKRQSDEELSRAKKREVRVETRVRRDAKKRFEREEGTQEENVKVQKENLHVAETRKAVDLRNIKRQEREEVNQELKLARLQLESVKKQWAKKKKDAQKEANDVKKDLAGVLEKGKKSHSLEYDAKLFLPHTKVISVEKYNRLKAQAKKKTNQQ
jgi:hypothetical protein